MFDAFIEIRVDDSQVRAALDGLFEHVDFLCLLQQLSGERADQVGDPELVDIGLVDLGGEA